VPARYTVGLRLGWLTDIHLNFVSSPKRAEFYAQVRQENLDALLLGGDIGEAHSVTKLLAEVADGLQIPIYFVLGNHDFYRGSFATVREDVKRQSAASRRQRRGSADRHDGFGWPRFLGRWTLGRLLRLRRA
jgi:predicted MPP superfamily phosphohydrolase